MTNNQLLSYKNHIRFSGLAITFLVLLSGNSFGQNITWQRTYDGPFQWTDISEDVCDAGNGNFYIVGTTKRPNSYGSIFVLKVNSYGDTLWTKYIDTASGKAVVSSGDGGCVMTGSKGIAFTAKVDSNGNIVWFKRYTQNIVYSGNDIIKTNDNGYLICGSAFYDSAYVFKIDSAGNLLWQKYYSAAGRKGFRKIINTIDGGFILAGYTDNSILDTTRGLISKINASGNIVWEKTYVLGGNTGNWDIDRSNNYFVVCGDVSINNSFRVFYKKFDFDGNELFSKVFISDDNESTSRIRILNDNKYIMTMSRLTNSFPFRYYSKLIITDSIGTITTQKYYNAPGDLNIYSILPIMNGDIMFVGYAEYYDFPIKEDVYLLRTDSLLFALPPIGIENLNSNIPQDYYLYNYPNPFNPTTTINYELHKSDYVKLILYDVTGREISILVNESKNTGSYKYKLSSQTLHLASGVYFVKILTKSGFTKTIKVILMK